MNAYEATMAAGKWVVGDTYFDTREAAEAFAAGAEVFFSVMTDSL